MPVFFSTGVGVGVLAGIFSGVCYLLVHGVRWTGSFRDPTALQLSRAPRDNSNSCAVCKSPFPGSLPARGASCRGCGDKVCRGRGCSDWDPLARRWECRTCQKNRELHLKTGQWFVRQVQERFHRTPTEQLSIDKLIRNAERTRADSPPLGTTRRPPGGELGNRETQLEVREFIEQLVASMAGGALDDTTVDRMYDHPECLPLGEGVDPGVAHTGLKRLVQKVIEAAISLPDLLDFSGVPTDRYDKLQYDTNTYEELLATAVLNKVIDSYQNKHNAPDGSSGINSEGSDLDSNSNVLYGINCSPELHKNRNNVSPSSPEPMSEEHSCSPSDSSGNQTEPLASLTIEECIEEITTGSDDDLDNNRTMNGDDFYLSCNLDYVNNRRVPFPEISVDPNKDRINNDNGVRYPANEDQVHDTWEDNWLFQKKRLRQSPNNPVPMLVPSPNAEYRALIGDRDADDTTDLSEAGSDTEEDALEDTTESLNVLVQSKTIIGGKNPIGFVESKASDNKISNEESTTGGDAAHKDHKVECCNNETIQGENMYKEREDDERTMKSELTEFSAVIEPPTMFTGLISGENSTTPEKENELESLSGVSDVKNEIHNLAEAKNVEFLDNNYSDSGSQKDSEYTEQYDAIAQRLSLTPTPTDSLRDSLKEDSTISQNDRPTPAPRKSTTSSPDSSSSPVPPATCEPPAPGEDARKNDVPIDQEYNIEEAHWIPGSIAEREHLKWQNAVHLENNPYSQEAILKRLSGIKQITTEPNRVVTEEAEQPPSADVSRARSAVGTPLQAVLGSGASDFKRYGRDYYINDAKRSTGTRKRVVSEPKREEGNPAVILSPMENSTEHSEPSTIRKTASKFEEPVLVAKRAVIYETDQNIHRAVKINIVTSDNEDVDVVSSEDPSMCSSSSVPSKKQPRTKTLPMDQQDASVHGDNTSVTTITNGIDSKGKSTTPVEYQPVESVPLPSVKQRSMTYTMHPANTLNMDWKRKSTQFEHLRNSVTSPKNERDAVFKTSQQDIRIPRQVNATEVVCGETVEEPVAMPSVKELMKKYHADAKIEASKPKVTKLTEANPENATVLKPIIDRNLLKTQKNYTQVHSLTARSISREFREGLKATPVEVKPETSQTLNADILHDVIDTESTSTPESPVPKPGTLKNSIAFFEELKNK